MLFLELNRLLLQRGMCCECCTQAKVTDHHALGHRGSTTHPLHAAPRPRTHLVCVVEANAPVQCTEPLTGTLMATSRAQMSGRASSQTPGRRLVAVGTGGGRVKPRGGGEWLRKVTNAFTKSHPQARHWRPSAPAQWLERWE